MTADGAYQERISTKEGCHALEFLNKLFRLGYAEHQQTILTAYNIKRRLNSGQVLCFIGDVEHSGINPEEWNFQQVRFILPVEKNRFSGKKKNFLWVK